MPNFFLDKLALQVYILAMAKKPKKPKITPAVQEYIRQVASMGGKARAAKHDKATLSKWARKGGRRGKGASHDSRKAVPRVDRRKWLVRAAAPKAL